MENAVPVKFLSNNHYFPPDVFKWMKKNAKPKAASKLMKVCKYFQDIKLSIVFVKNVTPQICWNPLFDTSDCKNLPSNSWLIGKIMLNNCQISKLINKTIGCSLQSIDCTDQIMSFDDFKLLTSGGIIETMYLTCSKINFKNGQEVSLERILEYLPNIVKFYMKFYIPTFNFKENLNCPKLKEFTFWKISPNFNIMEFYHFMIKHQQAKFYLVFGHKLGHECIQNIQIIFDKIVENWYFKNNPPQIVFPCQVLDSIFAMEQLRNRYLAYIEKRRPKYYYKTVINIC